MFGYLKTPIAGSELVLGWGLVLVWELNVVENQGQSRLRVCAWGVGLGAWGVGRGPQAARDGSSTCLHVYNQVLLEN